nr:hypothetical protein [Holospora obtusa]
MSFKIYAPCDTHGNPVSFTVHKDRTMIWKGGDALMDRLLKADTMHVDKAYDADERGKENLKKRGVIPPKKNCFES